MYKHELGSYQFAMEINGETTRAWAHKNPSECYWSEKKTNAKATGGLLGFLSGITVLPIVVDTLDRLADLPNPAEAGLAATGIVLLTGLGIKAGEAITNYEKSLYQH